MVEQPRPMTTENELIKTDVMNIFMICRIIIQHYQDRLQSH